MVSDILTEAITVVKQRIERSEAAYEENASAPEDWNQTPEAFFRFVRVSLGLDVVEAIGGIRSDPDHLFGNAVTFNVNGLTFWLEQEGDGWTTLVVAPSMDVVAHLRIGEIGGAEFFLKALGKALGFPD